METPYEGDIHKIDNERSMSSLYSCLLFTNIRVEEKDEVGGDKGVKI